MVIVALVFASPVFMIALFTINKQVFYFNLEELFLTFILFLGLLWYIGLGMYLVVNKSRNQEIINNVLLGTGFIGFFLLIFNNGEIPSFKSLFNIERPKEIFLIWYPVLVTTFLMTKITLKLKGKELPKPNFKFS